MKTETGGNAFPRTWEAMNENGATGFINGDDGMTLRDYFAAKAMAGFNSIQYVYEDVTYERVAAMSYEQADAMIAERNKGEAK